MCWARLAVTTESGSQKEECQMGLSDEYCVWCIVLWALSWTSEVIRVMTYFADSVGLDQQTADGECIAVKCVRAVCPADSKKCRFCLSFEQSLR